MVLITCVDLAANLKSYRLHTLGGPTPKLKICMFFVLQGESKNYNSNEGGNKRDTMISFISEFVQKVFLVATICESFT